MWDGLSTTTLVALAGAAVMIGAGLGLLPRSRWRFALIGIWSAAPVILVLWATGMTAVDMRSFDLPMSLGFAAVFTLILLAPWALLTLLPFNSVRRYREIQRCLT